MDRFGKVGKSLNSFFLSRQSPTTRSFGRLPFNINVWHPFNWAPTKGITDVFKLLSILFSNKIGAFLLGTVAQIVIARLRHYWQLRKWRRQIFLDRVQAVLFSAEAKTMQAGRIEKRTMFEVDLPSVLGGNEAAAIEVRNAAEKCTVDKPFLTQHLEPWERYHVLNAVLNVVSCQYSAGHLIADLGGSYVSDWYAFAVTAEAVSDNPWAELLFNKVKGPASPTKTKQGTKNAIDEKTKKLRVILVKESTLQALGHDQEEDFHAASGRHDHRLKLLRSMSELMVKQALDGSDRHILRVMLAIPSATKHGRVGQEEHTPTVAERSSVDGDPFAAASSQRSPLLTINRKLGRSGHQRNPRAGFAKQSDSPAMYTPRR